MWHLLGLLRRRPRVGFIKTGFCAKKKTRQFCACRRSTAQYFYSCFPNKARVLAARNSRASNRCPKGPIGKRVKSTACGGGGDRYPKDIDPRLKAAMAAALLLIDYQFFEDEGDCYCNAFRCVCGYKCCVCSMCGCLLEWGICFGRRGGDGPCCFDCCWCPCCP